MKPFYEYSTSSEIHNNEITIKVVIPSKFGRLITPEDAEIIECIILSRIDDVLLYIINKHIYLTIDKVKSSFIHDKRVHNINEYIRLFKRIFYRTKPALMTDKEHHEIKETLKYSNQLDVE